MNKYIVITTINEKSKGIKKFEEKDDWHVIIVGDKKSKSIKSTPNLTYLSVEDQLKLDLKFVKECPYNHYTRKNIGYLYAIKNGADVIYDTDDDNIPYGHWSLNDFIAERKYASNNKFINIYRYFSKERIWPRGFPLDEYNRPEDYSIADTKPIDIGVWQGMADNEADVDAVYRLLYENKPIKFEKNPPIALGKNHYCPFNSQNTFWKKTVFPYLYLPATVSFRFTDILRGYIAQRLFWEHDYHLGFTGASVYQERNVHNLMKDFGDEIECYLNAKQIISLLDSLHLKADPLSNLEAAYKTLAERGFIKTEEYNLLEAWISDLEKNNF